MIDHLIILLVAGIMFFVDDDQPEISKRQKKVLNGPQQQPFGPEADRLPCVLPLAITKTRMPEQGRHPEAR